jgi:predicted amino acid-binding ACT domain protein
MDTGPGYNSKRQEAVDSMLSLLTADPGLMQQAGDLIFRNMDFPGAEIIADRLAAANPLAQIDDKSSVPPQVQMQLAQSKQVIEQLTQQIQEMTLDMKYGASVAQQKDEAATKRKLMEVTAKAHQVDVQAESAEMIAKLKVDVAANDTVIDNQTKLKIESIKAQLAMLLASLDEKDVSIATEEAIERSV